MATRDDPDPADEAAARYARLHASGRDRAGADPVRADDAGQAAWLAADDGHRREWSRIARAEAVLDAVSGSDAIRAMVAQARVQPARRGVFRYAAAASIVLAAGGAGLLALHEHAAGPSGTPQSVASADYATATGERRTVTLTDGSVLTLDTDTHVRVALGGAERRILLDRGQAFFRVAKDKAHPFIVSAGGNAVTALGTQFDVRVDPGRFSVALVEGKVRVDTPEAGRATILHPGVTLVAQGADVSVDRSEPGQPAGWTAGHLRFDATPLSEAVAEMNRYSATKMVIADPALATEPVSGVFRTDGGDAFVHALQQAQIVRVGARDHGQILLRRF